MYEEISLDAIESNKDEAPDYRPMLKSGSPGAPTDSGVDFRMRYLSTLESVEKASYDEFARIADSHGLRKVASVFREILKDEEGHEDRLSDSSSTMVNLKTAIDREEKKIGSIKAVLRAAEEHGRKETAGDLRKMIAEEEGHVRKLSAALSELEKDIAEMKRKREEAREPKEICSMGVCRPKTPGFEMSRDESLSDD